MRRIFILLVVLVCSAAAFGQNATQGSLFATDRKGNDLGPCPLKTTAVKTDISGFIARVTVRQEFENNFASPIEAVYVFPLSQNGAVDRMTMTVGQRTINGKIMKREEARQVYETAKSEGKVAALLDQERPNIFTQSVANIMPGETVIVEISYVETLKYEDGAYEFVFPMTVAPRYIPGGVKDATKISPPVARSRAGHDISIEVDLNAGVPVEEIRSTSHQIVSLNKTASESRVTLRKEKVIPNKDFILRYDVTGKRIEDAVLTHRDARGGFFTLLLQPPDKIATEDRTPKEIVFVLDTSGSMDGFPIEKAKEAMRLSLDGLYPEDTFNLITFAGDTEILFDKPVPATQANLEKAQAFIAGREGAGGTEMMKAIKAALEPSDSQEHLRIVCFMTDGAVGNDDEIIAEVQRHPKARVFSFGIGSSVNRSLLDKIALEGRGEAEYVALEDDGSKAAKKFYERVRTPLLTDLSIEWNGMPVTDIYPNRLTDLFSAKPVIVHGRYTKAASGAIKLKGNVAGQPYERTINLNLPDTENRNDVLASLWARTLIDDLASSKLNESDSVKDADLEKRILDLGLNFHLLTEYTSFVAVENKVVNQNGQTVTLEVPVVLPEGMDPKMADREDSNWGDPSGKFLTRSNGVGGGGGGGQVATRRQARKLKSASKKWGKNDVGYIVSGSGGGSGAGSGSGYGGGVGNGNAAGSGSNAPPPPQSPGSIQATVNVTAAEVVTVDATSNAISTTYATKEIQTLPSNGRQFMSLLRLAPGVTSGNDSVEQSFMIDGTGLPGDHPGSFEGKVSLALRPDVPMKALLARKREEVSVAIEVDSFGNVAEARAVSGPELLRDSAEKAARLTRFAPPRADEKPVRMRATLVYAYALGKDTTVSIRGAKAFPPTDADRRLVVASEKLHFWLTAVVRRLAAGDTTPTENEGKFVRDGLAEVKIELTTISDDVVRKLKGARFVMTGIRGKSLVGHVSLNDLATLAEIDEVKLVVPRM